MTTVFDITLRVAREITDVLEGTATAGAATSLTDTNGLTQPNSYYDRGTIWIKSGTHQGKVLACTGHLTNKLNFATLGATPIAAGDRYAVVREAFPWNVMLGRLQDALDETYVTGEDSSLTGDGETLEFTLPAGVRDIKNIETEDTSGYRWLSAHWKERLGKLRFDYGYAPDDGDTIHIFYRKQHAELTAYSTTISDEIDLEWLRYKAAEQMLWWAHNQYKGVPELGIDERMTKVQAALKGRYPRRDGPDFLVKTMGG